MNPINKISGSVCAAHGFSAAGLHSGIRNNHSKKDLAMIVSDRPCTAAAVYTQNKVCGAPLRVTKAHLADGRAQAVICNSGNANTCNADGEEKAKLTCELAAQALGLGPEDIIIASTGVIGMPILMAPFESGIPALAQQLSIEGQHDAAEAIMTTDTKPKERAVSMEMAGHTVTIGAIAKGSGMIAPNMATMLSFVTTDAAISADLLQQALSTVVQDTYNMISIDGDTSTNDMVAILANGAAGNPLIDQPGPDYDLFVMGLYTLAADIARLIAGDGEGATKLLQCTVSHGPDQRTAKVIAKSVINSSLVKTAMYGADANWGRILCAIGYADADFILERVDVALSSPWGRIQVCRGGNGVEFSEPDAKELLLQDEINIEIDLNQGEAQAIAWGCDLTHDYVTINGDYRT